MKITYLVSWNIIGLVKGGIRVIYEQIDRLVERGHDVKILALNRGGEPKGYHFKAEIIRVERFDGMIPLSDITVASFGWAALPACQVIKEIPFYLIQCIEGDLINHPQYKKICEASYQLPLNLISVSRGLKGFLERKFHRKVHLITNNDPEEIEDLFNKALERYSKRLPQDWHRWEKVLMMTPDDPWAHYQYGVDLQRIGDPDGAKREYKKAIELSSNLPLVYRDLGRLLAELGDHKEAMKYLREAKRITQLSKT